MNFLGHFYKAHTNINSNLLFLCTNKKEKEKENYQTCVLLPT